MAKDYVILNFSDPAQKKLARTLIQQADGLCRFTLERLKDQRSLSQNAYMWGVVLPRCAKRMAELWGESVNAEDAHEFFKRRFLTRNLVNQLTGEGKGTTTRSTASLDTGEFTEYLDSIIRFAAEQLNESIPLPIEMEAVA